MKEVSIGASENGFTRILSADELLKKNIVIKGAYSLLMKIKNTDDA